MRASLSLGIVAMLLGLGCTPGVDRNAGTVGGSTSAMEPSSSSGVCVPDCGSKTCGSDGCDGICGECEVGSCSSDGRCCGESWEATFPTGGSKLLVSGDRVFVAAQDGSVRRYACDGSLMAETPVHDSLTPVALVDDGQGSILAALDSGTDASVRWFWKVDPETLAFDATKVDRGGADSFLDGALVGSELWVAGKHDDFLDMWNPMLWRIPDGMPDQACSMAFDGFTNSVARSIAPDGRGGVYLALTDPAAVIHVECNAGCACTQSATAMAFDTDFTPHAMHVIDEDLYVAGATPSLGLVYRVGVGGSGIVGKYSYDATAGLDEFNALVDADGSLIAVGGQGISDPTDLSQPEGLMVLLPTGFVSDADGAAAPLAQVENISAAAQAGRGLYITGLKPDSMTTSVGFVRFCSIFATCEIPDRRP